jgi:bacillolysin
MAASPAKESAMPLGFSSLRSHREDIVHDAHPTAPGVRAGPGGSSAPRLPEPPPGASEEEVARWYLGELLASDGRADVSALKASGTPGAPADMTPQPGEDSPLTNTRVVFFGQRHGDTPVFGAHAFVELDRDGKPIGACAEVVGIGDVPSHPTFGKPDARDALAATLQIPVDQIPAEPTLSLYNAGPAEGVRLVWLFERVPAAPLKTRAALAASPRDLHGMGPSPRQHVFSFDYLVDAEDGRLRYHYSRAPLVAPPAPGELPTRWTAPDDERMPRRILTHRTATGLELWDPTSNVRTLDLAGKRFDSKLPADPVHGDVEAWPADAGAAVTAHYHAGLVCDFFSTVLKRRGIDGEGGVVESVVNCTYDVSDDEWRNAMWNDNRMWYGRARDGDGYRSYARYLDVVAHELTHGVTASTAGLVYRDQSGALDESFSDIFGIIIRNWFLVSKDSVAGWTWEIGPGLGEGGKALRSMKDPASLGHPVHVSEYKVLEEDWGGAHRWCSIHNLAAYHVLTAKEGDAYVFSPEEVAILYHLTLCRLDPLATFEKALVVLLDMVKTYYADRGEREAKAAAIVAAYAKVGIGAGG